MKLKNIILFGTAVMALTACDDLIDPALENNQEITEMYNDPQFARGLIDNAFLVLPYALSWLLCCRYPGVALPERTSKIHHLR